MITVNWSGIPVVAIEMCAPLPAGSRLRSALPR